MNISNKELYELTFFGWPLEEKMLLAFSWHLKIPSSGGQAMHQQVTWLLMAIEENGALFGCPSGIQQKMQNEDVDPKDPKDLLRIPKQQIWDAWCSGIFWREKWLNFEETHPHQEMHWSKIIYKVQLGIVDCSAKIACDMSNSSWLYRGYHWLSIHGWHTIVISYTSMANCTHTELLSDRRKIFQRNDDSQNFIGGYWRQFYLDFGWKHRIFVLKLLLCFQGCESSNICTSGKLRFLKLASASK